MDALYSRALAMTVCNTCLHIRLFEVQHGAVVEDKLRCGWTPSRQ